MKEITKEEAYKLGEIETDFQVIINEEDKPTDSVVILKKFRAGFILKISCNKANKLKFYFSEEFESINQLCTNFLITLEEKGNPFLENGMSKKEMQGLASQLGKPEGEKGKEIRQMMNDTNISMTRKTMHHVSPTNNERILELGPGNANHLVELFNMADNLQYSGLDISELMKEEAQKFINENGLEKNADFQLYDGTNIPFPSDTFDKIFTVNTIYFWQQPVNLLNELNRILKPNGILFITFVDKETMEQLTFTEYGFTKYDKNTFHDLAENCKLKAKEINQYLEIIKSKMLGEVERKYSIATLTKGSND